MKQFIVILILVLPLLSFSQESEKYYQVETIRLSPNPAHVKVLAANIRSHNMKYHATAPYTSLIFNVSSGPDVGDLIWMMGHALLLT